MFDRAGSETPAAGVPTIALLQARRPGHAGHGNAESPVGSGAGGASSDHVEALEFAWQHSGEPGAIVDETGRVARVNHALAERVAATPAELVGVPLTSLVDASTAARCWHALRTPNVGQALERRGQLRHDVRLGDCHLRIIPVGDPPATQLVLTFPSDRAERARLPRTLRAVARLAGEFAHDLNNELAVLVNCTSILQRRIAQHTELAAPLRELRDAAWRSARLARTAGQLAPDYRWASPVRLERVVADMVPLLELVLQPHRRLEVSLPERTTPVAVPRGRIEQVLLAGARMVRHASPVTEPLQIAVVTAPGGSALELRMGPLPAPLTGTDGRAGERVEGQADTAAPVRALESLANAGVVLEQVPLSSGRYRLIARIPRPEQDAD